MAPPKRRLPYPSGVLLWLGMASAYTHNPSVMQPFVASMEVVGVPLGSGQPMVLRVASWWSGYTGMHRSGGVPTDGQQVSFPLCRFVSVWGAVCLLTL